MTFYRQDPGDGSTWRVDRLDADREPCIVCGAPNGDCIGEQPLPAKILLHGTTESLRGTQGIYVEEDIFGQRNVGELTTVRFLLAKKGSTISFEKAQELGII